MSAVFAIATITASGGSQCGSLLTFNPAEHRSDILRMMFRSVSLLGRRTLRLGRLSQPA
jgi:hypothetical protein